MVIDPPFITRDVWEKYAVTTNALLKYSPFGEDEGEDAVDANDATRIETTTGNGNEEKEEEEEEEGCEERQRSSQEQQMLKGQRRKCGYVLGTTVAENQALMQELFNAKPTIFKPTLPHLVYQYGVYVNFIDECSVLKEKNPELYED